MSTAVSLQLTSNASFNQSHYQISPSVAETLGLNLNEEASIDSSKFTSPFKEHVPEKFTLRQAAYEVIEQVNKCLQSSKSSTFDLVVGSPWDMDATNLYWYEQYCGLPPDKSLQSAKKTWLNRILQALVDKNYIKGIELTSTGYAITA